MYLKKLEIQGFKSFADKVELEFNGGITAVVGPNGCGKSNISDAIRWVLGEQSVKNLRGSKMEDVIFAGTPNRKALGFASVTITFDNRDGTLPIDYEEVAIGRKLYRSGESEYSINGTPCRLKDITDLLYSTGIGKDGYSIIGQGQVEKVINSRPDDRREIFDEATGISKYKYKKQEAIKKLEEANNNLQRLDDIIGEVEIQRASLKEQADKARRYIELYERLKTLEVNGILKELDKVDESIGLSVNEGNLLQVKINGLEEKKSEMVAELEERKEKCKALREEAERLDLAVRDLEQNREKMENQYQVLHERLLNREKDRVSYENEIAKAKGIVEHIEKQLEECSARIGQKQLFLSRIDAFQMNMELKLSRMNDMLEKKEKEEGDVRDIHAKINYLVELIKKNEEQLSKLDESIEDICRSLEKKKRLYGEEKKCYDKFQSNLEKVNQVVKEKSLMLDEINESLEKHRGEFYRINKEIDRLTVKLSGLKAKSEQINRSVKALVDARYKDSGLPQFWPVIDLVEVPEAYRVAVEVALGSALYDVVVNTDDDARALVEYLKQHNLGRVTFIPLNAVRDVRLDSNREIYQEDGFIDYAIKLINYEAKYDRAIKFLFDRVLVCRNMDSALRLSRKYPYRYKIVTLEGEIIYPSGLITGGSLNKSAMVGVQSERRLLESAIGEQRKKCREAAEKIKAMEVQVEAIRVEIARLKQRRDDLEKAVRDGEVKCHRLKLDMEFLERQLEQLQRNKGALYSETEGLKEQLKSYSHRIDRMEENSENWQQYKDAVENLKRKLLNVKLIKARYQEQVSSLYRQRDEHENALRQKKLEIDGFEAKYHSVLTEIDQLQARIKELAEGREELKGKKRELMARIVDIKDRLMAFEKEIEEITRDIQDVDGQLKDLAEKKMRCQLDKAKWELKRSDLVNALEDLYGMSLEQAQALRQEVDVDSAEVKRLKKEIELLGDVNKGSIEEYRKVDERYLFLDAQRKDLQESMAKIQKVIDELNEAMKQQFISQLELINKNFDRALKELFGGGKGRLILVDSQDVLQSGIDIEVRLPGKKVQNMQLLSGGEKALCAISLLFAFLYANPSPFCVLDEIDASLDEANVERFASFLQRLSQRIQFIVITHRRGTMMAADYAYGVSMPEQGVSRLLSVKIDEEAS